jgi:predicted ester cyclase
MKRNFRISNSIFSVLFLLLLTVCPLSAQDSSQAEAHKALLRKWFQVEAGRYYDRINQFFTEDLVRHSTATDAVMPEMQIVNRDAYLEFWGNNVMMFPDYYVTANMVVAEGDLVAFHATFNGTYIKNGNHIRIPMVGFARFEGDLIDELWVEWDNLAWNTQMMGPPQTKEVPVSSIDDIVGVWRLYGAGWAGYLEVTKDGKERYFEPGCEGRLCTDVTQARIENHQLLETGSSAYPKCDARYNAFVIMQGAVRIGLRLEAVGPDCYRERAEAYSHIIYFVVD